MSSPPTTPDEVPIEPPAILNQVFDVFGDSPDSKETIIYLAIGVLVLIALGLISKLIFWFTEKFRYPGWKFWSVTTRQKLAILWTTSWLSLFVELFFMLSALFSITTFVYITIIIARQSAENKTRSEILSIPWLYWSEFFITILCGIHILFRLYTSRRGMMVMFDMTLLTEVINGIPLLTSPFRGQFAWNFQYLRVIRLHRTLQFLAHHPKTSFSGKTYLLWSYIFTTLIMLFGAGGFFFVLENKYFTKNGQIKDMVDAMYYVIITVSTCGYGDISPKTVLGRIGAIVLALCALIYIPIRVARLVAILSISTSGVVKKPGGHVILSASTTEDFNTFISEFFHSDRPFSNTPVALLAPNTEVETELATLVQQTEYTGRVQALQGSLAKPDNYPYYYLESAAAVLLMADKSKGATGDALTLVTAMSLLRRFPRLPLYIQVQSEASKRTAVARGISRTLCIQELRVGILRQNTLFPGFAPFLLNLMKTSTSSTGDLHPMNQWLHEYRHGEGYEFYSHAPLIDFVGLSFAEAAIYIAKKFNITLIGIIVKKERLVAKELRKSDPDEASSTTTATSTTTTTNTTTTTTTSESHSIDASLIGESIQRKFSPDRSRRDAARKVAAVSFDRDRRAMQTSIDEGARQSIDIPAGGVASLLNPDEFELIVEWDLMVNPGSDYIITTGDQGVVLAKDEDAVLNIFCDDIKLVQKLSSEVAMWKSIPDDQRYLYRNKTAFESARTEPDPNGGESPDQSAGEEEEEQKPRQKKVHIAVEPAIEKKHERERFLKDNLQTSAGMVRLSKKTTRLVPEDLKRHYALVQDVPLTLDEATKTTVAGTIRDHIVVVGDWMEDMYDIALGFRSKILARKHALRPLVFLGSDSPSKAMWNRVSVFENVSIVIGSQVDPKDLTRAGVVDAFSVLVVSLPSEAIFNELLPDAKSLATFLILEKLTRAHITIELLQGDSLGLLLKGHAPLYSKRPPAKHPDRANYDACNAAYKEISKLGTSANPYFASGCVFVNSFLDALLGTAFYNDQIVPVLAAFTSPDAFQAVMVSTVWEAYPGLRKRINQKKRKTKQHENNPDTDQDHDIHHHRHRRDSTKGKATEENGVESPADSAAMPPSSSVSGSKSSSPVASLDLPPHGETAYKPFRFSQLFAHFLKFSDAIVVAVVRRGFDVRPYVVTCPPSSMVMHPDDVVFILESNKIRGLSNVYNPENFHNTPGSLVQIPHSTYH